MRTKRCFIAAMVAMGVLLIVVTASAGLIKCEFNAMTTNYPPGGPPFQIGFWVNIEDTTLRPAEALSVLTIQAPDGTIYDYSQDYWKYYAEWGNYFFFTIVNPIQEGTYKITVKDKSSPPVKIVNSDKINDITPLPPPNVIYPIANALVPLEATFSWDPVPGAKYYRIEIFNDSAKSPVFSRDYHPLVTYKNYYVVPKGVLQPNRNYSIQVEARDSDKNVKRRSRTFYIPFRTEP